MFVPPEVHAKQKKPICESCRGCRHSLATAQGSKRQMFGSSFDDGLDATSAWLLTSATDLVPARCVQILPALPFPALSCPALRCAMSGWAARAAFPQTRHHIHTHMHTHPQHPLCSPSLHAPASLPPSLPLRLTLAIRTGRRRMALVRMPCIPVGRSAQEKYPKCDPERAAAGARLALGFRQLATDCGLGELVPRTWVQPVHGVLPDVAYHLRWGLGLAA